MNKLCLWLAWAAVSLGAQAPAGYLPFAEAGKRLAALAQQNPQWVKLETIGTTPGGRKILALEIAAPGAVPPAQRPAVFLGANLAGFHNAGSQAAIAFAERLLAKKDDASLASRTFYIIPILNPDAHDGMFATVRHRLGGNGAKLDRDRDGLTGEDGPDDLNQDGRITQMRIADPAGTFIPDPNEPRAMIAADPLKGQRGQYRLLTEGFDNDKDGQFNEDGPGGFRPDRNFAHAWNDSDPESGVFPGQTPEARAVMDYLLKRRNVAVAFLFGPANNLLELPRGSGTQVDVGQTRVRPPRQFVQFLGLEENREYTVDEIYELVKDSPIARQQPGGLTKEALASFLGAGAATSPAQEDLRYYEKLAEDYKKLLDKAGLDSKRSGKQSQPGGLQNWLYYQYGTLAVELDVWGIPKKKAEAKPAAAAALSIESLEKMSSEDFLKIPEDQVKSFLAEIKAPAMITPAMLTEGIKSGKFTPARMAAMMRQQGVGGGARPAAGGAASGDSADLMAFIDQNAKDAFVAWTPVTLPDGTKAEVGGADPFVEIAPPAAELAKASDAHAEMILDTAKKLAAVSLASTEAKDLGAGVYRVTATAVNTGFLPTHTSHGARIRTWLPVRLEITLPPGATLVQGNNRVTGERLTSGNASLKSEWLVRAAKGARLKIGAFTQNAGTDTKEVVLP